MPIELQELQDDKAIQAVAKFCSTSKEFIALMNQVDRKLARRGDFVGTVVPIYICAYTGCITWPRYVESVRAVNLCNRDVQVKNQWYDFMLGNRDWCRGGWRGWRGQQCTLIQTQKSSVFQDIQGDGRYVRAYTRCTNDYGKTVTIYGTDNNGQPLMQKDANNDWIQGETIILQAPYASTSVPVRAIDYVIRDATQCPINLYAYNAAQNVLEDLAQYDGGDTRPSFQRTRLGGSNMGGCGTNTCCARKQPVLALVKLKHIDAVVPTDLLLIENPDAFVLEIQAIKSREAGDIESMRAFQAHAIEELNRDLENQYPDDQFSAINNVFGGATFSQQCF